jgi:hypothetical protein
VPHQRHHLGHPLRLLWGYLITKQQQNVTTPLPPMT